MRRHEPSGTEGDVLPDLRGALRHGRDGRRRSRRQAQPRPRPPALARLCLPEGHRDTRRAERPRSGHAPAAQGRRWRLSARFVGGGARRHRHARAGHPRPPRSGVAGLVHGQPRGVLLLAHAVGQGLPRRRRHSALLDRVLARRRQPVCRERAAVRLPGRHPHPRPAAHGLPPHARCQPARLARFGADRAPRARAAQRDSGARRARGRRRPAADRDRAGLRARRRPSRRRRLAAALSAARDLRGGPRRRGRARSDHHGRRRPAGGGGRASARGDGGARRRAGRGRARARARPGRGTVGRCLRPHRAWGGSGRSSPTSSTRSTR
jgi:hypothetical protein